MIDDIIYVSTPFIFEVPVIENGKILSITFGSSTQGVSIIKSDEVFI